jgi:hypothetical protein
MRVSELLVSTKSVQFVIDEHGRKKAMLLDLAVWEKILALLKNLEADTADEQLGTDLSRELLAVREKAITSGMILLTEEEIEQEITVRRGERS